MARAKQCKLELLDIPQLFRNLHSALLSERRGYCLLFPKVRIFVINYGVIILPELLGERIICSLFKVSFEPHVDFILVVCIVCLFIELAGDLEFTALNDVDGVGAFTLSENYLIFQVLLGLKDKVH